MAKNGEKWRKMAKNGDGEFGFFICQIRHFSPIFDFGISHLTDFQTANHFETLQSHYWHQKIYGKMLLDINFLDVGNVRFQKLPMAKNGEKWRWRIRLFHLSNSPFRHWPPPPPPHIDNTFWSK